MSHSTRTLSLNENWDLSLTGTGRIALSEGTSATSQAVANEVRRFVRDTYFDYQAGVPHFETELGQSLPESALRSFIRRAALRVPDVAEISDIDLSDFDRETRTLTGNISFRTTSGQDFTVSL